MKSLTEASYAQNEEVKKISAWAAILFAPTLDRHRLRHELRGHARARLGLGYPLAIALMAIVCATLYWSSNVATGSDSVDR